MKHRIVAWGIGLLLAALPVFALAANPDDFADKEAKLQDAAADVESLADQVRLLEETIRLKADYIAGLQADQAKVKDRLAKVNADLDKMQRDRIEAEHRLLYYVRSEYQQPKPNAYLVIASEKSFSANVSGRAYLAGLQSYTDEIAKQLGAVEGQIAKRQAEAYDDIRQLDAQEAETRQQSTELEAARAAQQVLLERTEGDEQKFREQFESAKAQLVAQGAFAKRARDRIGSRVWDSRGNYFNQLDSRWIDRKLGFSTTSTIGDYGCGLVALTTVFNHYGITTDPVKLNEDLKRTRAFVGDLLDWRLVTSASGGRLALASSPYPQGHVDWTLIDRQLAEGHPVIVYVERPGQINHYVTLIGRRGADYAMHDPIEGPYLRFSDYYKREAVVQAVTFRPR